MEFGSCDLGRLVEGVKPGSCDSERLVEGVEFGSHDPESGSCDLGRFVERVISCTLRGVFNKEQLSVLSGVVTETLTVPPEVQFCGEEEAFTSTSESLEGGGDVGGEVVFVESVVFVSCGGGDGEKGSIRVVRIRLFPFIFSRDTAAFSRQFSPSFSTSP